MASGDMRDELHCSICMEIYRDPVTLPCIHSFCRDCITQAWDHQEELQEYKCPECQHIYLRRPEPKSDKVLQNIAEHFHLDLDQEQSGICCTYCNFPVLAAKCCLQCETYMCNYHLRKHDRSVQHTMLPPNTKLEKRKCSIHNEFLEYLSSEDCTYICVSCLIAGEYNRQSGKTLEEAPKSTGKPGNYLRTLTLEREETKRLEERKRRVHEKSVCAAEKVTALFRDIQRQLENRKRAVISEISRWGEQTSQPVSELFQQLEIKDKQCTKELCSRTDTTTVSKDQFKDGGDLNEEVISDTLHILSDAIKSMQLCIKHPADILLDEKTAGNCILLSGDMKTASFLGVYFSRPAAPERCQYGHVISIKSFSSGQHSWEVDTSNSQGWRVGVCYPSIARNKYIGDDKKSWSLMRYRDSKIHCLFDYNLVPFLQPPSTSSYKFRIYLDYEAGLLKFYQLCDTVRHLITFSTTFTEPLHAAIFICHGSVTITS